MAAILQNALELNSSKRNHWAVDNHFSAEKNDLSLGNINVRSLNAYIQARVGISDIDNKPKAENSNIVNQFSKSTAKNHEAGGKISLNKTGLSSGKINVRSINTYIKTRVGISDLDKAENYDIKSDLDKAENDFSKVNLINSFFDITLIPRNNYIKKSQRWKCVVVKIEGEVFKAKLEDLTSDDDDSTYEIADFSKEEVSPSDLELLSIGAVFYWSVGYEMNNGQISKQSIVRFQRLVKWSADEFDEVTDRAKTLTENLLWD